MDEFEEMNLNVLTGGVEGICVPNVWCATLP